MLRSVKRAGFLQRGASQAAIADQRNIERRFILRAVGASERARQWIKNLTKPLSAPPARAVTQVEYERDAVRQALINRSNLSANEIADRGSVARALSGVIAEWAEHERRQHHP
jgi:hypothetical protein